MKKTKLIIISGIAAILTFGAVGAMAQTSTGDAAPFRVAHPFAGGNLETAQERYMQHIRDGVGLTNETDWSAIQPLVQKVFEAQRELLSGGGVVRPPMIHRSINGTNNVGMAQSGRSVIFGPGSAEAQAVQSALDNNASDDQIKSALEAYHTAQKNKRAKLEEAQENLRKALTPQQEARATLLKVLD